MSSADAATSDAIRPRFAFETGVRAAAGRVGDADLAVADGDDREQDRDRDADLERRRRSAADAAEDQDRAGSPRSRRPTS